MAQVRICMSCGTAWQAGSVAAVDGFCLQCPGELGPPLEDGSSAMRAAQLAAQAPPLPAGVTLPLEPLTSAAPNSLSPISASSDSSASSTRNVPAQASASTTAAVSEVVDDLEPPSPTRGSAALTKIHYAPETKLPGGKIRAEAQQTTPVDIQINIDPLTGKGTEVLEKGGSSRRHTAAGEGDTTAVIVTDGTGMPVGPVARQTAIGRIAGVTSGLPAKLARASWECRDCRARFVPGSPAIGGKRCGECGGKIEPDLAEVAAGTPCLVLYDPDTRVRIGRFALTGDVFSIGRLDPGAESFPDLNLSDYLAAGDARQVSRRQCEVQRDRGTVPETYYLAPVPGNSGVYVKGTLIEPGQRVQLAEQMLFGIGGDRIFLRFEANRAL